MTKSEFENATSKYVEGGIRKACAIIKEYKKNKPVDGVNLSAVSKEQYEAAVDLVVAYAFQNSQDDTKMDLFKCDSDCTNCDWPFSICPYSFQCSEEHGLHLCPHFCDSSNK